MALSIPLLRPVTSLTATSFVLNWSSVLNASEYVLYVARTNTEVADVNANTFANIFSNFHPGYNGKIITGLRWEVTNLLPNTTYYVKLLAKNSSEQSPDPEPLTVGTPSQALRQTARGLRVDLAFKEFVLTGFAYQLEALKNLLRGATELDGTYADTATHPDDVYAVAQLVEAPDFMIGGLSDASFPKASSYLTLQILRFVKGFKGKISSVLSQLRSEFSSFTQRSTNSINKATATFPTPYAMFGSAYASQFFLKDKTGAEPVPVKQDTFGYWTVGDYSGTLTGPSNQVVKPYKQPIPGQVFDPVNVSVDFLRVGTTFNIAVDSSSGQGGLQNRVPANVSSDTGYMIVINADSEPGRKFFVKTEKSN
jgi:hypothetical protein